VYYYAFAIKRSIGLITASLEEIGEIDSRKEKKDEEKEDEKEKD